MWKAGSKAFGEAVLDVLRAWGGCISQDVIGIYISGVSQERVSGPL
jgi:hypothetical protein